MTVYLRDHPAKVDKKHENSFESDRSVKSKKQAGTSVSKSSGRKSRVKNPQIFTDNKLEQFVQKWSETFSRLEAILLSRLLTSQIQLFSLIGPTNKPPPTDAVDNNQHFFKPQTDQPATSQQEPTNSPAIIH